MRWSHSIPAVIATAAVLASMPLGLAQTRHGGASPAPRASVPAQPAPPRSTPIPQTPIDEFETMSPQQRQRALSGLPPAERERLRQRLQKFNDLPPEQQQALKSLYSRLHQLPPERQEAVRKAVNRFSQQSPERQQVVREELQNLAMLAEPERQERLHSSAFRKKFSRKEQGILRDMVPLLPEP